MREISFDVGRVLLHYRLGSIAEKYCSGSHLRFVCVNMRIHDFLRMVTKTAFQRRFRKHWGIDISESPTTPVIVPFLMQCCSL